MNTKDQVILEPILIPDPEFEMGEIPFLFKQNELRRLTGQTLRPGALTLTQSAVDICSFSDNDFILDAGCGYGMTSRYLFKEHGIFSVGMDADFNMTRHAQDNHSDQPGGNLGIIPGPFGHPQFMQSRLPVLPFKSRTFNGIFCECVLSLVPDKAACLAEFFRILKKNGNLVLTDLYIRQYQEIPIGDKEDKSQPISCLDGALTMISLLKIIEAAGFKIEIIEDHTQCLTQLAGQMVFEYGSLDHFWETLPGTICDTGVSRACRSGCLKPGYCMVIAAKYE